jgi:hypothetical protein
MTTSHDVILKYLDEINVLRAAVEYALKVLKASPPSHIGVDAMDALKYALDKTE